MPTHTDPSRGERVLLGKLEQGAPCTLGPDEIAAAVNIINERERLISDRDLWKRTAQRLEREKIALAQDVLTHGEKRRAQAEALRVAADDCVPAMHQMANWLRGRADALVKPADQEYRCNRCNAPLSEGPDSPSASVAGRCLYFCDDCIDICDENIEFPGDAS